MKLKHVSIFLLLVCTLLAGACAPRSSSTKGMTQPDDTTPVSLEAVAAYESGERQKSLDLYRSLVKVEPENHVYFNNMGVILLDGGQAREALKAFERASLLAPDNTDYLVNVGLAHIKLGQMDDSLTFFDQALQLAPGKTEAIYGKGVAYLFLDEPEIALGFFHQVTALDPGDDEYLFMRAYAAQQNGLWSDAVSDYTTYIKQSVEADQKANAYSNRGVCYFNMKQYSDGMADMNAALKINDGNAVFYYNKAQGYQFMHQYEEAVMDYTRAISRRSGFPEAYINRGELRYMLGKEVKGCQDLKRACDMGVCGPLETYEAAGKCTN